MDDPRPGAGEPGSDGREREPWRERELQHLVADIAARLRKSCADLSDDEFSKLVLDIAKTPHALRRNGLSVSSGSSPARRAQSTRLTGISDRQQPLG